MLRVLLAAADDQSRAVPCLRAAAEGGYESPAPAADEEVQPQTPSASSVPPSRSGVDTAAGRDMGLRMVVRPGSKPVAPGGSPGQAPRVPVGQSSPNAAIAVTMGEGAVGDASHDAALAALNSPAAEKAFGMTARANKLIAGGLHNCPDWQDVRELYFAAAAHFQSADLHCEAGEAFSNAAAISRVYGSELEVATASGYAVDSFKIADPLKAVQLLSEIMAIHHDGGRPKLEAKAAKDIADIYEALGELQLALEHFKRADDLFKQQEITRNFHLKCLEKIARISAVLGQYRPAMEVFEQLVEAAIRGTRVTERYTSAMLCILADAQGERQAATLAKAKVIFDRYQDYDEFLQKGVENRLIKGLIAAFDTGSLAAFDATHKDYVEYRGRDPWYEDLIARVRQNLFDYLLPYM